jgi:predicted ABC-type ATPase
VEAESGLDTAGQLEVSVSGRLADFWNLYDNTAATPEIIASQEEGQVRIIETNALQ